MMSPPLSGLDPSPFPDIAAVTVGGESARRWGCGYPEKNRWIDSPGNRLPNLRVIPRPIPRRVPGAVAGEDRIF